MINTTPVSQVKISPNRLLSQNSQYKPSDDITSSTPAGSSSSVQDDSQSKSSQISIRIHELFLDGESMCILLLKSLDVEL